jgi:lysophospholipase L1-like esterase
MNKKNNVVATRTKWASFCLSLVVALALGSHDAYARKPRPQTHEWVAAWGTSLVAPPATGQGYSNQTLRLIVHPTLKGNQVRIRVANPFATQALQIGEATIGIQDSGANVATNTLRSLTFGGRKAMTIPPNALIVSDPVALGVSPQQNLVVSLYLPQNTGPAALHSGANQTSFVSTEGNAVNSDGKAFTTTLTSWPFLAGVEVRSILPTRAIVTFGDSITDGLKSTVDANHRWPDYFAARLARKQNIAVVNQGISGNRLLHDAAKERWAFGPNGLSRFDRDALTVSGASHIVVLLGINDIGMGSPARSPQEVITADDLIAGYRQLILRARAQGLRIIGGTLLPFGQAAYFTPEGETKRAAVNAWIRESKEFDAVIDFDRAVRDPNAPTQLLAAYDSGDHLHPSDAGYKAMADSIELKIFE